MPTSLPDVRLSRGEIVAAIAIEGPEPAWAARLEGLLQHKPPLWAWQCATLLREATGVEATFTVLHRDGDPFANVLVARSGAVGLLGHVFTKPEDRRKGAARALLAHALAGFRDRGGRALFLHTQPDGAPFRLYRAVGFEAIEPGSGVMAWYAGDRGDFERSWFAEDHAEIEAPSWRQWPASVPLFAEEAPAVVRCAGRGLVGRAFTEAPWLHLLRETERAPARVLVQPASGAVVGLAHALPDPSWPGRCVVDLHAQHTFEGRAAELLDALPLPAADRWVAFTDLGQRWKEDVLARAGFVRDAVLPSWAAADARRTRWVDVGVWERRAP